MPSQHTHASDSRLGFNVNDDDSMVRGVEMAEIDIRVENKRR